MSPPSANTKAICGEIKLYKRRWVIMGLFMLYAITTGVQWIEFSSIANIISKYYQVSPTLVEWTTIMYMVCYVLLVFPFLHVLEHWGIRNTMIIASAGACVGACIKILSVAPDRFYILMIGQLFEAIFTVLTLGVAARFTAVWFGGNEISRAGALALFGDQLGTASSFLLPTTLVRNSPDARLVESGMFYLHITIAVGSVLTLLLVALFFREAPRLPPSVAQARQKELQSKNIWISIMRILFRPSFLLIATSYSLAVATSNALATLLNQLILNNFPDRTEDAGRIGTSYVVAGMISALTISYILDKTGRFKENAVILTGGASISMAILTVALESESILYVYLATILTGIFLQGYYATGIQTCVEMTYPISEGISVATSFLLVQFISAGLTALCGFALKEYGNFVSNIGMVIVLLVSFILACLIPSNLRRQNVEKAVDVEMKNFLPPS